MQGMVRVAVDMFLSGTDLFRLQLQQSMEGTLRCLACRCHCLAIRYPAAAWLHICLMCSSCKCALLTLLAPFTGCAAGKVEGDQEAFGPSPAVRILQQNTRLGELLIIDCF